MNAFVTTAPHGANAARASASGNSARSWLARAGASVWKALEASGQARARREMLDFADRCESLQPTLAAELRAASNR